MILCFCTRSGPSAAPGVGEGVGMTGEGAGELAGDLSAVCMGLRSLVAKCGWPGPLWLTRTSARGCLPSAGKSHGMDGAQEGAGKGKLLWFGGITLARDDTMFFW